MRPLARAALLITAAAQQGTAQTVTFPPSDDPEEGTFARRSGSARRQL